MFIAETGKFGDYSGSKVASLMKFLIDCGKTNKPVNRF
jgi:hypothetical protein